MLHFYVEELNTQIQRYPIWTFYCFLHAIFLVSIFMDHRWPNYWFFDNFCWVWEMDFYFVTEFLSVLSYDKIKVVFEERRRFKSTFVSIFIIERKMIILWKFYVLKLYWKFGYGRFESSENEPFWVKLLEVELRGVTISQREMIKRLENSLE